MSLDTFEQSLLTELRSHVAARSPQPTARRSRRRIAAVTAGALATAAVAVALSIGTGVLGPNPAYAIDQQPDGDLVVTVFDLSDAAGLRAALAAKGVTVSIAYVPGFQQSGAQSRTSPPTAAACRITLAKIDDGLRFTLGAAQVASAATLDITTSGSSPDDVHSPVAVSWSAGSC